MAVTILVYSVFSALTAFAQSTWQVHVLRFLVALGTGGEWAIAAALVAETFPAHARAAASGIFHASSVMGVGLASLTGMVFVAAECLALGIPVGAGSRTPGPLDPAEDSRTRALDAMRVDRFRLRREAK